MVVKKMTKHLRRVKVGLILGILLISVIAAFSAPVSAREKAISFNSYIDLEYDVSALNEPLAIDASVSIPITVKYWTDIPDVFKPKLIWWVPYVILYGSMIAPMQKIHLEILETPEWANIYLSSPDVLTDIPLGSDGPVEIQTNLILSPKIEAPAESYKIDIRASCDPIKRLNGFTYQESVEFLPSFIPTIQITPENPVRTVGPHETVTFKINIENLGNKITRVTPRLIDINKKWTPTLNPPNYEIGPNQENTFTFSIIAPYDFGWHNEYGSFQIDFLSEVYPYRSDAATNTESIYLVINNYGFSTPGFEFPILLVALIVIGIIIQKRRSINT